MTWTSLSEQAKLRWRVVFNGSADGFPFMLYGLEGHFAQCMVTMMAPQLGAQALLIAVYDNLGKGASGAAVQNMDLMIGD
jgi:hypothetical protein